MGFLRSLREAPTETAPKNYSDLPEHAVYLGPPPSYADVIALVASSEVSTDGAVFRRLLDETLKESSDDDCLFYQPWSINKQPRNRDERLAARAAKDGALQVQTFYRVRVVVPPIEVGTIREQGQTMVSLLLASYCQRIMNAKEDARLDPRKLSDPRAVLDACEWETPAEKRRVLSAVSLLKRTLRDVRPIVDDQRGFEIICNETQLHWVKVGYIKQLAQQGGPFPRQQDLNPDGLYIGVLTSGRKWSLSHGWSSEMHPSPSGEKMRRLATKLESLGAHDERDGVFLE